MKKTFSHVTQACAAAAVAGLTLLGSLAVILPAKAETLPKLAVLDTQLIDYVVTGTGEPVSTAEDVERVKLVSDVLRQRMAELGIFQVLPRLPETGAWEDVVDLSCSFCILDIAKAQGADFVMTSAVLRVSTIIVYLKVELDNVATAKAVKVADISFKNFGNEKQVQGAADYWMKVHGDALKEALEGAIGSEQNKVQ
jgi:hypothetical protein